MQIVKIVNLTTFKLAAIVCCIVTTTFTLSRFALLIQHLIVLKYNWQFEFCMVTGMMLFQYLFIYKKSRRLKIDYYFTLLLVSLLGAVLLWPLLYINLFNKLNDVINLTYFFTVVILLFFVHRRAVAILSLPQILSYSWVFYRFIILLLILLK